MINTNPKTMSEAEKLDAFWRASNYLSACQLYLLDNPLLERKLTGEDVKKNRKFTRRKGKNDNVYAFWYGRLSGTDTKGSRR